MSEDTDDKKASAEFGAAAFRRRRKLDALAERRAELWVRVFCQHHQAWVEAGRRPDDLEACPPHAAADAALREFDARFAPEGGAA